VSFKVYVYVSDSKIDMLLAQIDPGPVGSSVEVTVHLPGIDVAGTRGSDGNPDRYGRLERVVRFLHDHGDLGSVDEPGQFFGGLLPMRWGFLPGRSDPSLVFFAGCSDDTVLGLGGSARHLIGVEGETAGPGLPMSLPPLLLDGLAVASDLEDEHLLDAVDDDEFDSADLAALATVCRAVDRMSGPVQNVEFIAKRLLHGPSPFARGGGVSVLLGSPLYVALVD